MGLRGLEPHEPAVFASGFCVLCGRDHAARRQAPVTDDRLRGLSGGLTPRTEAAAMAAELLEMRLTVRALLEAFAELESKKHARGRALQYARRTLERWQ